MGNKKARNEALLAALTKFMAWTERTPQQEDEVRELKQRINSIGRNLGEINNAVVALRKQVPAEFPRFFDALDEQITIAIEKCVQ